MRREQHEQLQSEYITPTKKDDDQDGNEKVQFFKRKAGRKHGFVTEARQEGAAEPLDKNLAAEELFDFYKNAATNEIEADHSRERSMRLIKIGAEMRRFDLSSIRDNELDQINFGLTALNTDWA